MHDMDDDSRLAILGEALMDELKVIREYLEDMVPIKQDVKIVKEKIDNIESDISVLKAIARNHSRHIDHHEVRITKLEAKPA